MSAEQLLRDALEETGVSLDVAKDEAVRIVVEEAALLALASGEPGFDMVVRSSRDNVALRLGINSSLEARAADSRIVGIIQAILIGVAA